MGFTIEQLRLAPNARRAAELVQAAHPQAQFTSGRRDVYDQARVMAANVVRLGAHWLKDTYRDPRLVKLLMTYVAENPEQAASATLLTNGFYEALVTHYAGELTRFPHLRGDAFDLAWPVYADGVIDRTTGNAMCHTIETLPVELGLRMILKREGKLDVIHAEFAHAVEPRLV